VLVIQPIMKQKKPLVSLASTRTTNPAEPSASLAFRTPLFRPLVSRPASSFQLGGSGRAGVVSAAFLVNLSRLLVPLLILISTTRCTTTTSLSPLGLYKVGIGATNLVDNILGHGITRSKTTTTSSTTDSSTNSEKNKSGSSIVHQSEIRNNSSQKVDINGKRNNKSRNDNKTNIPITNKKKRRDKNKNSVKRSNSEIKKKKNTRAKGFLKTPAQQHAHKNITKAIDTKADTENNNSNNDEDMLRIPGISEEDQKFLDRVQASARTVQNWDADQELLKKCRAVIPWEELLGESSSTNSNGRTNNGKAEEESKYCNSETDRLLRASSGSVVGGADSNALFLQRLCRWFQDYMSWVNAPPCKVCSCTECEMKTVRGPETPEEIEGEAKRVEVYYCPECKANTTTFPRYNKAAKLLETRQGRCGEYANLFGLFCRSAGFETRLVLDWSDHLWTELRLGDSWVMADGCEGVIDKPSMYEHGWGKDGLSYMVGIGRDHVVDVTPRYTRQFMTDDFQTRRRVHTHSEETSERILQQLNERMRTQPTMLAKSRVDELEQRRKLEDTELRHYKQASEWTDQDKYGSGRISGSLAWRRSRQEAGKKATTTLASATTNATAAESEDSPEVAGFPVEAFVPARLRQGQATFRLHARPTSRHDGILVSDTPCAVGVANSISVVVVDNNDKAFGCILQSKSFVEWERVAEFIDDLPSGRIVLMNGKIEIGNETKPEDFYKDVRIARLGGWNGEAVAQGGVLFAGQIDALPDWTFCKTIEGKNSKKNDLRDTYEVEIDPQNSREVTEGMQVDCRLRTERSFIPQRIAGRLPEAFMPFTRQQGAATEKEKREAYLKFAESHGGRYCGYTTKKDSPVYLLDSTAYPLQQSESSTTDVSGNDNHTWNTFLELPEPLVPSTECGIDDAPTSASTAPIYDVPLDSDFFNESLGPNLLSSVDVKRDVVDTLTNTRLIGLYFSAHWCGPCRSFTPMLAEMYDYLTERYPTHGLDIVFVSSDRDEQSFKQYYQSMPWKAIPFDQLQLVKQALNVTYGVRGIPSFVVLDAVSGQVVVSANESRKEVVTACRGGDLRIEAMFHSWLGRTPASTQELLSMIELSAREMETNADDGNVVDPDNNPYLKRTIDASKQDQNQDISIRFKAEFEKLVEAGHDPNLAAAKALTIVSESSESSTLAPGRLDGKASYAGQLRPRSQNNIDDALDYALERNSASTVSDALSIALKYLKNSQKTPWEPKFRRFKLSNKVADKITRIEGGLGLIQTLGFEVIGTSRDFEASIPVAANLKSMDTKITQLINDLKVTSSK